MKIAVTGATGFVGGAVCRAAAEQGHDVLAFGRRPRVDPKHVADAPYESWDIGHWPLAVPAVDAVVHCAGMAAEWGSRGDFHTANVLGTVNVLDSFRDARRVVHISTASVYDPTRPTARAREDAPLTRRRGDYYGASKRLAEDVVRHERPDAVILRPHAVYGPGDTTLLPRVLGSIRPGPGGPRLFAVGDGRQPLSLTGIGNLTQAVLSAVAGEASGTFNIADAAPVVLDTVLREVLDAKAPGTAIRYLPLPVADALAVAAESAHRALRRRTPPPITRYAVLHLAYERTLNTDKARAHLGYRPTVTDLGPALADS